MNGNKAVIGFTVLAIIGVGAGATALALNNGSKNTQTGDTATQESSSASYKDGTYSARGQYSTPAGTEQILVSLTLKNGLIEDANVTAEANDRESREYEERFISGYKTQVVGKSIDTVKLNRVSGSSLTGIGFNAAVTKIKSEAKI